MRKQIVIGLSSGKALIHEILETNVLKIFTLLRPKDKSGEDDLVDVKDLVIQGELKMDHIFVRPRNIELLIVGDVQSVQQPKTEPKIVGLNGGPVPGG